MKGFDDKVKAIEQQYGSLQSEEALRALLYAMPAHASWMWAKTLKAEAAEEYRAWVKNRYGSTAETPEVLPAKFSHLVNLCAGECHDTALAALLMAKIVEKHDPKFRVKMARTEWKSAKGEVASHFFTILFAPNGRAFLVDPLAPLFASGVPLGRALGALYPEARRNGPHLLDAPMRLVDPKAAGTGVCRVLEKL